MLDHEAEEHNQTRNIIFFFSFVQTHTRTSAAAQKQTPTEGSKAQKNRVEFRATSFLPLLQTKVSEKRWEARRRCGQRESKRSNSNESKRASCESGTRQKRGSRESREFQ
ncbi:unnamed protein product [Sphagnum troendelagicum]|uniref:Uncharacterized protein n=1 Tax=Sphagnum troendelagicum TaxID=128251 RepID=A0ABP0UHE5_9BRYO